MTTKEEFFVICFLIITLLATACNNNQSNDSNATENLSDRATSTMAVESILTDLPVPEATNTPRPLSTSTLVPTATPTSTTIPTQTPVFNTLIGTWEGKGTVGTFMGGSFDTERRIEVRANCKDNSLCVDVYLLDNDTNYLSIPYDSSMSDETRYCFGSSEYNEENQSTYSICLLFQANNSLEFSEGDVAISGDGILHKVP